MPSATTKRPNCCACELRVRSPCAAKRLSSFGLCCRLIPGFERVPTSRLILRPLYRSTGARVEISSTVKGSVFSSSSCPFLELLGDISCVGSSYIEPEGVSPCWDGTVAGPWDGAGGDDGT